MPRNIVRAHSTSAEQHELCGPTTQAGVRRISACGARLAGKPSRYIRYSAGFLVAIFCFVPATLLGPRGLLGILGTDA